MTIDYSRKFIKHFKSRVKPYPKLHKRYDERLKLFTKDPSSPVLKDHKLVGKFHNFRAFSVAGDVRVVYFWEDEEMVIFVDIGTHNQVYS